MILYLSSVFDKHPWARKEAWIADTFHGAHNPSLLRLIFKEVVLLVHKPVVDKYHQKLHSSTALNEQFVSQPYQKMPTYLQIIATKEAHQWWKSECKGDVGIL